MSKIEYFYDNKPNPLKGFFSGDLISQNDLIFNPTVMSQNNMVRRVDYNLYHGETTPYVRNWFYSYRSDNYPASVGYSEETIIYTTVSVLQHFSYNEEPTLPDK